MALIGLLPRVRRQLRIEPEDNSRDDELKDWVADAVAWVERETGHILEERDVTEQFRGFGPVTLKAWPIKADAVPAVAYIGADDTPVSATGRLDISGRPARVLPPSGSFWPFVDSEQLFSVTIRAGYGDEDDIPGNLKRAMLMLITAYDQDREGGDLFKKSEATARKQCETFVLALV
ncbi:phage gp6-like head-tail connector protein [Sphingomonas aliaeris]|uniref:Phage gp6-like head-tail connector protein n=1 Tax=Sphingomonas aliaeris TaxID=2759526 RepID=A0A974S3K3_9SPHN|nr:phage gp6-like head-tail connector protein [Sphingomonas aliaeris]QQV76524.1 phage gp6-like head-tail connector protein [Sphingomonas aliaeris]